MNFIIGAKEKGHKTVSSQLAEGGKRWVVDKEDGRTLTFCWRNGVRLNANNPDLRVNALDLRERLPARTIRKGAAGHGLNRKSSGGLDGLRITRSPGTISRG